MTARIGYALGALACAGLLVFGLYLQHVLQQEPCPLCILQRVAFIGMMAVFIIAALHSPGRRGAIAYSAIVFAIAGMGGAVAARQVWLQHLPANQVPACGPGLEYMLERFPLAEALRKIFAGSGECAEVGWRFLGASIAEWALLWFVLLAALAVLVAVRTPRTGAQPPAHAGAITRESSER